MDIHQILKNYRDNYQLYLALLGNIMNKHSGGNGNPEYSEIEVYIRKLTRVEDEVIEYRLKKILLEEHPYLPVIDVKKLTKSKLYPKLSLSQVIEHFINQRKLLLKMLENLPVTHWERTGVHESEGHIEFKEYVERLSLRDKEILSEIQNFKISSD